MVTETHRKLIDNFYKLELENKRLREALEEELRCPNCETLMREKLFNVRKDE